MSPDSSLMEPATVVATQVPPLMNSSKPLSSSSSQATSLKVVIVGIEGVGKTSFVRRFVAEELGIPVEDVTPTASSSVFSLSSPSPLQCHPRGRRERPPGTISTGMQQNSEVGLDIYELELPSADETSVDDNCDGDSDDGIIHRLSLWDFSGKAESLQAVQKVFFTPQTLYVVLWDMAAKDVTPLEYECATATPIPALSAHFSSSISNHSQQSIRGCSRRSINGGTNQNGSQSQSHRSTSSSTFNLGYDSDSDSSDYDYYNDCDVDLYNQEELRSLKRKLEKDIDRKVQFWIDRIQSISPGATILPMVTHTDQLRLQNRLDFTDSTTACATDEFQRKEVKKRCWLLKERLASNECRKLDVLKQKLSITSGSDSFARCLSRPKFLFGNVQKDGQVIPHAVAASSIYDEDKGMGKDCIDHIPVELPPELVHECKESFSSARNFILCTALAMADGEKQQEIEDQRYKKKYPTFHEKKRDEESKYTSLATVMLRDVRQKLWHRSKIVQTNYFTEKFETPEHNHEGLINFDTGDDNDSKKNNNIAVQSALNSLHLSGELCFFGGTTPSPRSQSQVLFEGTQVLSDFVVLDPTWLVESIDFILQYGKKFVENTMNGRSSTDVSSTDVSAPSGPHRDTNCPTIEKEEVRRLWKNRYSTKQGLGLAEHYHQFRHSDEDNTSNKGVADQVFEFIQNLLIRHDVFVPLSYQKSGSTHFFLPCLLHKKTYSTIRMHSPQNISLAQSSSILQNLTQSNNFIPENQRYTDSKLDLESANLKGACHGYVIVDTAPETLMERAIVHTINSLNRTLNTSCEPKIEAEELFLWKDSFRLKLRLLSSDKKEDQSIEINSVLLEAPGCGANSRIVTCDSMLVTYLQGCDDSESQEICRQTCLDLRQAIQNALDEIPGIEYREEGICPHCLRKNQISDTGTWTLSKLKSAFDNKEAFVRCRHGHRTETKLNGLLHCQLVEHQRKNSTKNDLVQKTHSLATDVSDCPLEPHSGSFTRVKLVENQLACVPSSQKETHQDSPLILNLEKLDQMGSRSKRGPMKDRRRENPFLATIEDQRDIELSSSNESIAKSIPASRMLDTPVEHEKQQGKEEDPVFNTKVILLLDRCKARMERLFYRKYHLGLDNRHITDSEIPMEKLQGTKFGHKLQSMSLSYNKLETLPQSLVRCLPNLRVLNLSHCVIYELPKRWNLPLLKKLDISHNLLITFPEEVRQRLAD